MHPLINGIAEGNAEIVKENVNQALAAKQDPAVILNEAMMAEVGHRFECGEYYVPE